MKKTLKRNLTWILIAFLILLIITIILLIPSKERSFEIKDRCGPIMNLISHTIKDEAVCKTRCRSQCETIDLKYSRVEFQSMEIGCHSCTCFCKKGLFVK
ncbi:hypothetical protein KY366_06630, partial [Candidatus Woesearchaeota archaeon]|nr:hypothetical protein [Candidatus Woesearchaeota archaeon]